MVRFSVILFYTLFSLIACQDNVSKKTCPKNWISGEKSCYLISDDITSFSTASVTCRRMGSHLVVFDSLEEYLFLIDLLRNDKKLNQSSYFVGYEGRMMTKYNLLTEAMYNGSFLFMDLSDYIDPYTSTMMAGSVAVLETYNSFNISFWSYSKSGEGQYVYKAGYVCEREKSFCLCSKWNEPVVRDFDGRSIPLLPTCRYTMLNIPGQYKVDMVLKHQSTDAVPQAQQDLRIIYGRPHSYIEITIGRDAYVMRFGTKSPEIRKLSTGSTYQSRSYEDDLVTVTKQKSLLDTFMSSEFPLVFKTKDGNFRLTMSNFANIEISLQYNIASGRNVEGVCGHCSDDPKDGPATFIGKNNFATRIPLLFAQSWADNDRKCLGNMAKPATCVSDTLYHKSIERCAHLQSTASKLNEDGCVQLIVQHFTQRRVSLFTGCVSSVCEFGPKAACYYFTKALQFCSYSSAEIASMFHSNEELDCDEQALCVIAKSDPTYSFNEETVWNGTCYMMNRQNDNTVASLNGFSAEGFCQQNLFHLAAIDSNPELIHVINYFALGHRYGKNGTEKAFWLGRTSEDMFKKQASFDSRDVWFLPQDLLKQTTNGRCTYVRGAKTNPGWDTTTCSDAIPGALCMFRSYVLCKSRPCFHPYLCDSAFGTCYDPCFDEGFIVAGQCYQIK